MWHLCLALWFAWRNVPVPACPALPPCSHHQLLLIQAPSLSDTTRLLSVCTSTIGLKSKFRTKSIVICLKEIQNSDCKSEKSSPENEEVAFNIANKLLNVEKLSEVYSVDDYKILINKMSFKGFFEYYLQLYISKLFYWYKLEFQLY